MSDDIVHHISETQPAPQMRNESQHTRLVSYRLISFTCKACSIEVSQMRLPGPTPKYCCAECKAIADRELARLRKRRQRNRSSGEV